MQTFLPYQSFGKSASVLDRQRLGKQRVEVLQILNTLKYGSRWMNHPAVKMWRGHEQSLIEYGIAICLEWKERGYKDTCLGKITNFFNILEIERLLEAKPPVWLGDEKFHSSHRAALLAKNYEFYSQFGWREEPKIAYHWPI